MIELPDSPLNAQANTLHDALIRHYRDRSNFCRSPHYTGNMLGIIDHKGKTYWFTVSYVYGDLFKVNIYPDEETALAAYKKESELTLSGSINNWDLTKHPNDQPRETCACLECRERNVKESQPPWRE